MLHSNCNYHNLYISSFKGHNGKTYTLSHMSHRLSKKDMGVTPILPLPFTTTAFGAGFSFDTKLGASAPHPPLVFQL